MLKHSHHCLPPLLILVSTVANPPPRVFCGALVFLSTEATNYYHRAMAFPSAAPSVLCCATFAKTGSENGEKFHFGCTICTPNLKSLAANVFVCEPESELECVYVHTPGSRNGNQTPALIRRGQGHDAKRWEVMFASVSHTCT